MEEILERFKKAIIYKQYHNSIVFLIHCDDYKQAKTHHKGRINKKWAKRYGYVLTKEAAEQ